MPETNESEVPTPKKKRNERTEAKFLEEVDRVAAEAERLGANYQPPNRIALLAHLNAKRNAVRAQRTVNQERDAGLEIVRNNRERLYAPLNKDITSLVEFAKAAGVETNDINALKSIARDVKGVRAKQIDPSGNAPRNSVAQLSFASRADNYARFIEQYDALGIATGEDFYQAATHRARLDAIRQANTDVINAEAAADTSGEQLDRLAYLDPDSLLKSAQSAKSYIKSKFKNEQSFKNISKTRLEMPSRLRRK